MAHAIMHDVFPAYVVVVSPDDPTPVDEIHSAPPTPGAANFTIARVVVTKDKILIAVDANGGPRVIYEEGIQPETHFRASNPREKDSFVTTLSGQKIAYKKDTACGCGSRLRSWNPGGSIVTSTKDPTE